MKRSSFLDPLAGWSFEVDARVGDANGPSITVRYGRSFAFCQYLRLLVESPRPVVHVVNGREVIDVPTEPDRLGKLPPAVRAEIHRIADSIFNSRPALQPVGESP